MPDDIKRIIAVVDDDYRILESLESLLESAGHSVRLFSSGEAFLESGVLADLDCLISDVSMPGVDGFGLLRITRLDRPDLPVIFITGREELINSQPSADGEPRHFFKKPFDGKKLLSAVSVVLSGIR